MPIDPRINCAAEICCAPGSQEAHAARVAILMDLGVEEEQAHKVAKEMSVRGIAFLPAEMAAIMREVAFGPTA